MEEFEQQNLTDFIQQVKTQIDQNEQDLTLTKTNYNKLIKSSAIQNNLFISQKNNQHLSSSSLKQQQLFNFTTLEDINPIILLKKPNIYKQCFQYLYKTAGQQLDNQNYDISIKYYQKAIQLIQIGRNIINKQSFHFFQYIKILIYANLSCAYLNTRKLQKCNKYGQKAIQQIQKMLISSSKQIFLKLSIIQMILKFQHCAILSQLQQHQRSLQLCKSNLNLINKYLQVLDIYVKQSLLDIYQKRKKFNQTVQFSKQVFKFAAITIKQLLEYIEQPMLKKQQMVFYYWQKNPQKNQQQLLKKFVPLNNQNCKRSILGVTKKTHWIDQFNIGSVMHMVPLYLKDLTTIFPVQQYLFKDKLYQITIYTSMCYFTMATQTRFIDSNINNTSSQKKQSVKNNQPNQLNSQQKKQSQYSNESSNLTKKLGNMNLMKKYGYFSKTQLFKKSQIYHLCSIDVMSRVVKYAIPYITHIIRSYQKHYIKQKKLQHIVAIIQQSFQQQDTIINQSIAQYMPFDNMKSEKSILRINNDNQGGAFSKNKKNLHVLDDDIQQIGQDFDQIIATQNKKMQKNLLIKEQNIIYQKQIQSGGNSNSQQINQNSGQYLQSVVKKNKTLKNSKKKQQKIYSQNIGRAHFTSPQLKDSKQLKSTKKKLNLQKSPISHTVSNNLSPKNIPKPKKKV